MQTETTATVTQTDTSKVTVSSNTKNTHLKDGAFKALAVLGAIAIIYIGGYALVLGVSHIPKV